MTMREYIEQQRREYLQRKLEQCGSIRRAAADAGITASWFSRLLRHHGIEPSNPRNNRGNAQWRSLKS